MIQGIGKEQSLAIYEPTGMLHESATTPAASCKGNCLVTREFMPLSPGVDIETGGRTKLVQIIDDPWSLARAGADTCRRRKGPARGLFFSARRAGPSAAHFATSARSAGGSAVRSMRRSSSKAGARGIRATVIHELTSAGRHATRATCARPWRQSS